MRIYVCGRLALEHDTIVIREADFPARQGRRLWAYLVLHRRWPVARDDLADAIWGEDIPDTWDATLNALISRLRSIFRSVTAREPAFAIRGEVGRYALQLPADAFVDVERARAALHLTDTLMRGDDPAAALAEARVAMEIAARGFLNGEEAPWIQGQRRLLEEIRLHALERTVEAELRRHHPDIAEREAEQLIALSPLRESAYRLLMRAHAASGNAAEAARVIDACRRTLHEQLAMRPTEETERLFREISAS